MTSQSRMEGNMGSERASGMHPAGVDRRIRSFGQVEPNALILYHGFRVAGWTMEITAIEVDVILVARRPSITNKLDLHRDWRHHLTCPLRPIPSFQISTISLILMTGTFKYLGLAYSSAITISIGSKICNEFISLII